MEEVEMELCPLVAFYGGQFNEDGLEGVFETLLDWFRRHHLNPDALGASGSGLKVRIGDYDRGVSRLRKHGFRGLNALHLLSLNEKSPVPIYHWKAYAAVVRKPDCCYLTVEPGVVPLPSDDLLEVAEAFIRFGNPSYGIGLCRFKHLGPQHFALGLAFNLDLSGPERTEASEINAWGRALDSELYREGMLRGVYPWNFLNENQLRRTINGIELQRWIEQSSSRGVLRRFTGSMVLWELNPDQIASVVPIIREAGALVKGRDDG
jgi:hypothetical protein